ncbi:MAG: hypothetical protein QOG41_2207 [Thermoleophilaceae bacterium]|nr:hypothetical protein [Thermoleophilaceae bacterium]
MIGCAARCLLMATAAALVLAGGVVGSAAGASRFSAARTAAGPSAEVLELGGVSLARDGTGAVAWLQRELTQPHVFAARLRRGDPTGAVRVDSGQLGASSDVRVATADHGKTVATWINGGTLYGAVETTAGAGFGAPVAICSCGPVSDPSLDISRFGTAYVTFTAPGGGGDDVRAAMLEGTTWTLISTAVDFDPARDAFGARVAASSDGTGIAAWTERDAGGVTHVYERRLLHDQLSEVPRQASLPSLDNRSGGNADSPSLGVTDESSFAWVAFRQDFSDGAAVRSRVLARRLRGSAFDHTFRLDGLQFPTTAGARSPAIALSGRGYGVAVAAKEPSNGVTAAALVKPDRKVDPAFQRPVTISSGNSTPPIVAASAAESARGLAIWQKTFGGGASVKARPFDGERFTKAATLSPPELGPSVAELGLDAEGDDADDHVIAFVQGDPGARRIQVVAYAGELDIRGIVTRRLWYRTRRPHLRWDHVPSAPWGPVTYRVEVDGKPVGRTRHTELTPKVDLREGLHSIHVVAIDARKSETRGDDVDLGTDTRRPKGSVRSKGHGLYRVWASDGSRGSGVFTARLEFDGGEFAYITVPSSGRLRGVHVHTGSGLGHPRLVLRDRAGNRTVIG